MLMRLLNARSVNNKMASISNVVMDEKLDLLMITETWIDVDAPDIIKLGLATKVSKLVVVPDPVSFELLPLRLTCQDCVLTLLLIYRPPSSSVTNFLQKLLDLLDDFITAELLICSDFNLPGDSRNTIDSWTLFY